MGIKHEEQWKQKGIRMPEEFWYELMKQAKLRKVSTAEFVRNMLQKMLDQAKTDIIYDGEVVDTQVTQQHQALPSIVSATTTPIDKYACGCKKGETKLCPKHHRM